MRKAKEEGLVEERGVPEVTIPKSPGTTGHPLPGTACPFGLRKSQEQGVKKT